MKRNFFIVLVLSAALLLGACSGQSAQDATTQTPAVTTEAATQTETTQATTQETTAEAATDKTTEATTEETTTGRTTYTDADIAALVHLDYFLDSTIEHIFYGTINKQGKASGYHYDGVENTPGEIIEGTKTEPDENGVYTAKVRVDGIDKSGNKGYSTFYPEYMSPQDVIDAINQAYENKELVDGSLYAGLTDDGIEIDMALTDDGLIITAYPIKEE